MQHSSTIPYGYMKQRGAFSLVELSIVLVILGLLVGGVLTGKSLIEAAAIKSQMNQIDQYRAATQSFRDKYFYLPGDLPNAAAFGFHARNGCNLGYGDGNGVVQGVNNVNTPSCTSGNEGGGFVTTGELLLFWQDLSLSSLIGSSVVKTADGAYYNPSTNPSDCFPPAKLGGGNYVYAWSGGPTAFQSDFPGNIKDNSLYFGVAPINYCTSGGAAGTVSGTGMTVQQAYNMDKKLDDGLPQSGTVLAVRGNSSGGQRMQWAAGGGLSGASGQTCCAGSSDYNAPTTVATPYATTNCYDNNNVAGPQNYSMQNADAMNCALSFRM